MEIFSTIKLCTHGKLNMFEIEPIICIKMDLALNNPQRLRCHKTQTTNQSYFFSALSVDCYPWILAILGMTLNFSWERHESISSPSNYG